LTTFIIPPGKNEKDKGFNEVEGRRIGRTNMTKTTHERLRQRGEEKKNWRQEPLLSFGPEIGTTNLKGGGEKKKPRMEWKERIANA